MKISFRNGAFATLHICNCSTICCTMQTLRAMLKLRKKKPNFAHTLAKMKRKKTAFDRYMQTVCINKKGKFLIQLSELLCIKLFPCYSRFNHFWWSFSFVFSLFNIWFGRFFFLANIWIQWQFMEISNERLLHNFVFSHILIGILGLTAFMLQLSSSMYLASE